MAVSSSEFGPNLHAVDPATYVPMTAPPVLWKDHSRRSPLELPMWALNARQIAQAHRAKAGVAYRLLRVANTVGITHNLCLTTDALGLDALLAVIDPDLRGFAVEGIGMGLATRRVIGAEDLLGDFLDGPGRSFLGLPYTGIGMGLVHAGAPFEPAVVEAYKGLSRWMILDGLAFWSARQTWETLGAGFEVPSTVDGPVLAFFDRGLGRCAWFQLLGQIDAIAAWAASAPPERRPWIWYGLGVASTFTGGVEASDLMALRDAAGPHRADLAAGSIQAAEVRFGVGIDTTYTARAVQTLAGVTPAAARNLAQSTRDRLGADDGVQAARAWVETVKAARSAA